MSRVAPERQRQLMLLMGQLGLPMDPDGETALGVPLDWELLDMALTHASVSAQVNYERLELLGDSALRLAATEYLMVLYPQATVGELSMVRSRLVSDTTLATLAQAFNLRHYLRLSVAAAADKTATQSILADALEAILGAFYTMTEDLQLIRPWLTPHLHELALTVQANPLKENAKSALQELTQARYQTRPEYQVVELNQEPGCATRFQAEAWFQGRCWGQGVGRSMKQAEQAAAETAYYALKAYLDGAAHQELS